MGLGECSVFHDFFLASGRIGVLVSRKRTTGVAFCVRPRRLQIDKGRSFLQLVVNRRKCLLPGDVGRFKDARFRYDRVGGSALRRPAPSKFHRSPPILGQAISR